MGGIFFNSERSFPCTSKIAPVCLVKVLENAHTFIKEAKNMSGNFIFETMISISGLLRDIIHDDVEDAMTASNF